MNSLFLQSQGDPFMSLIFMGGIIAVAYFFLIRPQNNQRKKQREFIASLERGSKVVTIGGIHGTIVELTENTVTLVVDGKNKITFQRDSISFDMTTAMRSQPSSSND